MDTLKGIPEHVESEFGDSIVARDELLGVLNDYPGLGPPDLCWLQKTPKKALGAGADNDSCGYYHWYLGRDVSSSAAIAAHFAALNRQLEKPGLLQGLFWSTEYAIERGFYCCFDPFSRVDVRCEFCIPGGVLSGAVDSAGDVKEVSSFQWHCVQVRGLRCCYIQLYFLASMLFPGTSGCEDCLLPLC